MRVQATTSCCGVLDLIDIFPPVKGKDGKPDFSKHMTQLSNCSHPFIFFAGQVYVKRYAQLAQYIRDNSLGKVQETDSAENPNSKNMIIAYLWEVDWKAMARFKPIKEQIKEKLVEVGEAIRSMAHPTPSTVPGAVNIGPILPPAMAAPGTPPPTPDLPTGNPLTQVIREMGLEQANLINDPSYQDKLRLARDAVRRDHATNRERRMVARADQFDRWDGAPR